jgi:hypothetical protein
MAEGPIVEEELEETVAAPPAEEPTPTEAELAAGAAGMQHSVEDIPELAGKRVGDTMMFAIRDISDDGNMYTLVPAGEEGAPAAPTAEEGRAAVEEELLGPEGTV